MAHRLRMSVGVLPLLAAMSSVALAQQAEAPAPPARGFEASPPVFPSRPPPAAAPRPVLPDARGRGPASEDADNRPPSGCQYVPRKLELIV